MTTHASLLPGLPRAPDLLLSEGIGFRPGRVHEGCGPARRVLAALLAGRTGKEVLWARRRHSRETPFPAGLAPFCNPARILHVLAESETDLLWTMEEGLRSGALGLVLAELSAPPGLTPVRRLQLAAEAAPGLPLGLLLTPEEGGAPGVESRWHFAPAVGGGWQARRLRARLAPETTLHLALGPSGLEARPLPQAG